MLINTTRADGNGSRNDVLTSSLRAVWKARENQLKLNALTKKINESDERLGRCESRKSTLSTERSESAHENKNNEKSLQRFLRSRDF